MLAFRRARSPWLLLVAFVLPLVVGGCDSNPSSRGGPGGGNDSGFNTSNCTIPTNRIVSGCDGADCIPSIDGITPGDDRLVDAEAAEGLADSSRVIGLVADGQALAVPHSILWTHEIVNVDEWGGRTFAVTYCPLTGSSLAFDRSAIDGAEFGVSGLLFNNNLVMYDRRDEQSLWPQMSRRATCGQAVNTDLSMMPVIEMQWGRWRQLHPETQVASDGEGFQRVYPYGDYELLNTDPLVDIPVDDRRPPKERVLGLPNNSDGGIALPFRELDDGQAARVVTVSVVGSAEGRTEATVFWRRSAQAARAFETSRSFSVRNGQIVDDETGSVWSVEGRAIDGPLAEENTRLTPIDTAYVAFWFAWASFQSTSMVWTDEG